MAETNLKNLKGGALKKALQKVGSSLWAMDTTKDNIKILLEDIRGLNKRINRDEADKR